jgi:serine/threonine protein kinase
VRRTLDDSDDKLDAKLIAKKLREESNELEILRFLDTIPLKSDHVIPLIDSFNGWAILPKMSNIKICVYWLRDEFKSKIPQICLGIIKGVAFLHEHRIAHRDIKGGSLVVDENYCLKIIDFDNAMRVEDEDEEVDDYCGTEGRVAPEVEKKLRHSPIKADRWACGRILQILLDSYDKDEKSLGAFAEDLMAHNPKQRPSLLEWAGSDTGKIWNANKRKDPVEEDGESTKPPMAKKQRLDGLGQ